MAWQSPTGYNDPDNRWNNETNMYDDDITTYAYIYLPINSWSSFIEATIEPLNCDKIRYYAGGNNPTVDQIDVDVYYSGAWHDVYSGTFTHQVWEEKSLGGTYAVTKMRISLYNNSPLPINKGYIYEVDFNQVEEEEEANAIYFGMNF